MATETSRGIRYVDENEPDKASAVNDALNDVDAQLGALEDRIDDSDAFSDNTAQVLDPTTGAMGTLRAALAHVWAPFSGATAFGKSLLSVANAAALRAAAQLGTAAQKNLDEAGGVPSLDANGLLQVSQMPTSLLGGLRFQGTWNAATNTPAIPAAGNGNKGYYYRVAVAGATNIDGIAEWKAGDWIISEGTKWTKIDNTDAVTAVAGRTGNVTLSAGDIAGLGQGATLNVGSTPSQVAPGDAPSPAFVQLYDDTAGSVEWDVTGSRVSNGVLGLSSDLTLSLLGVENGCQGLLIVRQENGGGWILTLPPNSLQVGGGSDAAKITSGDGGVTILAWLYDGADFLWSSGQGVS